MFLVCKVLVQFCRLSILSWVEWVIIQNCCDLGGKMVFAVKEKCLKGFCCYGKEILLEESLGVLPRGIKN